MKIIYKSFVIGFMFLLVTLSCEESFLEISPYGSLNQSVVANGPGLNTMLIGAYAQLANGGYLLSTGVVRPGDDQQIGTETGPGTWGAYLYSIDEGLGVWRHYFMGVLRANEVLKLLPSVKDLTAAESLQIEAEAKFLRGVNYSFLVLFFKNVPWIDETIDYGKGNYYVPNDVNVYPKVEADFKFAGDNLTATKSDVGRANKWAAKAFLAKTYMHQNKYADAKVVLDDIIANGVTSNNKKYDLLPQYNLNFIQRGKHGSEAVFTQQMDVSSLAQSGNGNPMDQYNGTYGGPATCCYGWLQATFDFVDAYQTDAVTGLPLLDTYMNNPLPNDNGLTSAQPFTPYAGTLDSRLDWCVGRRGIPYRDWGVHPGKAWVRNQFNAGPYNCIKNIIEQARKSTDQGTGGASNNPYNLIRFSDVLLWAAECEIEVGSLATAESLVNRVRARAANPDGFVKKYLNDTNPMGGYSTTPAANYFVGLYTGQFAANGKTYARKAVRFERRLEFGLEHHRFFDLLRWDGNDFNIETHLNEFLPRDGAKYLNKANNFLKGKYVRNKHEYLPIPLTEIDLSYKDGASVLKQNPGWN